METVRIQIRRLEPTDADAALFQEIRLEALGKAPEAFGSTFEREAGQPLSWFRSRLTTSTMFGAFDGPEPEIVGMAGLLVADGQKEAHKGRLISMYVRPRGRRAGVGQQLVEAVVAEAAKGSNWSSSPWSTAMKTHEGCTSGSVFRSMVSKKSPSSRTADTMTKCLWQRTSESTAQCVPGG